MFPFNLNSKIKSINSELLHLHEMINHERKTISLLIHDVAVLSGRIDNINSNQPIEQSISEAAKLLPPISNSERNCAISFESYHHWDKYIGRFPLRPIVDEHVNRIINEMRILSKNDFSVYDIIYIISNRYTNIDAWQVLCLHAYSTDCLIKEGKKSANAHY